MPGKEDVLVDLTYWKFMRYFSCRLYSSPAVTVPYIDNEPVLQFAPGSDERAAVEKVGSCIERELIDLFDTTDTELISIIIHLKCYF